MTDFSDALARVKTGSKITRKGWNAGGQYVVYQPGYPDGIGINANMAEATGITQGAVKRFRPYLMLHTAQRDFVPWAPSVSDVLANDWEAFFGTESQCASGEPEPDEPGPSSVDEVRARLDLPPWGLPETSEPAVSNNVTISVSTQGGMTLTSAQIKDLTETIQARLIEQDKRNRRRRGGL